MFKCTFFQLCTRFCFFGAFAKAASCSHPRLINFPEQKSFWNVTRPCDLTNGGGSDKGFTQNLASYDRNRCKSDWWGHAGVCQLCSRMPLSTILPWGITRFRFCHIILINMEPFEPAHRPVDVKGLTFVTFFNNFNFEGHFSCFTLGNQMARDSVQGHHVVI